MAPQAKSRFTAAHWAALACGAVALIALAIFVVSGWNQPHEPAVTTPHGNGSTDPSEPDLPPPANASAEASFPIL